MELTFAKCEQILNTLPIGYYTGRRIGISLDTEAPTSMYSPLEDKIIVSYPIIAERIKKMPEGSDEEEAVRSMLYHEVSHAILTPAGLCNDDIYNIMEDERIESVLRNYYHNVNFRKQLYDLHGGSAPKAKDTMTAFYNAVRFGLGTGVVQSEINSIIKKYAPINRSTNRYGGKPSIGLYEREIEELYRLVDEEYEKDPDAFNMPSQGNPMQMDSLSQNGTDKSAGEPQGEDMPEMIGDADREVQMSVEQVKRMVGASLANKPELTNDEQEKLNEFQRTIEVIIGNFNKKNSGGSGINTYSGVFNPRAVVRKDYRFFERSMSMQGNNRFGTCHLNLIIDCSGSFCDNVRLTNGILTVLTEIERKNRNFSLDVVFINHELHICKTVRDREIDAWGGNTIPANMKEVLLSLQKPQTCNYNIILFDGDAMCNNRDLNGMSEYEQRFRVFDMKQTTLITDPDNKQYIRNNFTSTKVIITKNYTEELVRHITHALTVAFG